MNILLKLILTTTIIFALGISVIAKAEVAVIINPGNTATLSDSDIKRIFLGKMKSFPGGSSALPVNLKTSSETRKAFDKKALGKSASQIKAYWSKLVFSGKGNPPKEVADDAEAISLVAKNPAVIAYIDSSQVTDSVKVIGKF